VHQGGVELTMPGGSNPPAADARPTADSDAASVFEGSIVALPTPFREGGLDLSSVDRLAAFHARFGSDGILVGGTAGEGWSLNLDESAQIMARATGAAAKRSDFAMRVFMGIAEIDSRRAARIAEQAVLAGADGLFISAPPHVRVSPDGLLRHVAEIAERLPRSTPIALLNEPTRTGADITPDMTRLVVSEVPDVVAHCEGIGYPGRSRWLARDLDVAVLTADDRMIGPFVRAGAIGALNEVGNLVPGEVRALITTIRGGGSDADRRERALAPLIDVLRVAPTPIAVKCALTALEAIGPELRPPLAGLSLKEHAELRHALEVARMLVPA